MRLPFFFAVVLLLCAIVPLCARDVEIIIMDTELGLPLEGAIIRSWDGREYICDEDGKAVVTAPDNRQALIQAAYPGYENGRLIITITGNSFTLGLRLSGIMESRELVIEAARPGTSETKTGRSVAISGRDIAQTGEIGIIEDVMSSVKLLPGVGYAGFFDALPSIRGGDPGDMSASLDGFYIFNPYHWGGGFSIFDPRMVQSAQLSHGVFSSRYGHTISGLLEISSKKPSASETEFELGVNTSAASFNVSLPLAGKGGVLLMGRVTYYDPVVALAQQMAKLAHDAAKNSDNAELKTLSEQLEALDAIRVAPYIRSGTITGNYRFFDNLELQATGFWGMDGIGVTYEDSFRSTNLNSDSLMKLDWTNYQGFFTAALAWNPRNDMLLKFSAGAGYTDAELDADMHDTIIGKSFLPTPSNDWYYDLIKDSDGFINPYDFNTRSYFKGSDVMFNTQGRIDYDWEPGQGFIIAAGVQEMFAQYKSRGSQHIRVEKWLGNFDSELQNEILDELGITDPDYRDYFRRYLLVSVPVNYRPDAGNSLFTTSGYGLAEYATPDNKFNAELGLRLDHFYLHGKGFSLQTQPALNPRLNLDYNVFKNIGIVESLSLSAGTGLFASMNDNIFIAEKQYGIRELKPNRSWTSVLGARLEFPGGINLNIEGYYKYIFDRMYVPINFTIDDIDVRPQFNGEGRAWGIDLLLQKLQSRFWDGWITYSYSWAKYRDPDSGNADMGYSGGVRGDDWYFPSYHRFHNLNIVLNVRPAPRFNIYTRFGLASGLQLPKRIADNPISYPVYVYDDDNPANNHFIEIYRWPSRWDENNRTTPSLPLDIKFSIFGGNNNGKVRHELYVAIENVLALLYSAQGNTSYNQYTGQVNRGSNSAAYELPIPIPSFGFKISY